VEFFSRALHLAAPRTFRTVYDVTTSAAAPPRPSARLGLVTVVMAVTSGVAVANLYYAQPLLELIARDFDVTQGAAAVVVTLTQIGYALGLLFVLPLGDLFENRRLITRVLVVSAATMLLAGLSPAFGLFLAVSVLVGVTAVVAQIVVPLAAHLAPDATRGKVVGQVMSGLLLGILLARSAASFLAEWLGWRAIYMVSAVLMLVLVLVLRRLLPEYRPAHVAGYRELLATTMRLPRELPVLRWRAITQASMFGAFTCFWTGIAYELIDEHRLNQAQIGVFALVGAAGAAAAPVAGRVADRGHGRAASGAVLALATVAMVLATIGSGNIVLLALAGVLLDFAVQSHQVMAQQEIYGLRAEMRARINTVYMTSVFVGGAIASLTAGLLHSAYGWAGVCWFGACLPLAGLVLWTARLRPGVGRQRDTAR
jgi:predicted MFS family arabinose efflux permease